MRLSNRIVEHIKKATLESFGDVTVYLFGSRVDDSKRGGDIDLAFDVELNRDEFRKRKIRFISSLIRADLDLKMDLVQYKNSDPLLRREIEQGSIKLFG